MIATGGLAPLFADCCPVLGRVVSDLTLQGLFLIHRRNGSNGGDG